MSPSAGASLTLGETNDPTLGAYLTRIRTGMTLYVSTSDHARHEHLHRYVRHHLAAPYRRRRNHHQRTQRRHLARSLTIHPPRWDRSKVTYNPQVARCTTTPATSPLATPPAGAERHLVRCACERIRRVREPIHQPRGERVRKRIGKHVRKPGGERVLTASH